MHHEATSSVRAGGAHRWREVSDCRIEWESTYVADSGLPLSYHTGNCHATAGNSLGGAVGKAVAGCGGGLDGDAVTRVGSETKVGTVVGARESVVGVSVGARDAAALNHGPPVGGAQAEPTYGVDGVREGGIEVRRPNQRTNHSCGCMRGPGQIPVVRLYVNICLVQTIVHTPDSGQPAALRIDL